MKSVALSDLPRKINAEFYGVQATGASLARREWDAGSSKISVITVPKLSASCSLHYPLSSNHYPVYYTLFMMMVNCEIA